MLKLEMIIILVILDLRQIRLPMDAKLDFVFLFRTFCDKDNSYVGHAKRKQICIRFIGISDAMTCLTFKNRGVTDYLKLGGQLPTLPICYF